MSASRLDGRVTNGESFTPSPSRGSDASAVVADPGVGSAWSAPELYLSPPAPGPSRVMEHPVMSPLAPAFMPPMPQGVGAPAQPPAKPSKPVAGAPPAPRKPRNVPQVSPAKAWGYMLGKGSAKEVLITRAVVALLVMIATTIVLIAASPRSVRVVKTVDGVTTSRPCIATAFGIGGVAFGVTLGVPYAAEFMRPSRK